MANEPSLPLRVEFLVNSLVVGGAERVVEALCTDLPSFGFEVGVGCLREPGPVGEALAESGTPVSSRLAVHRRSPLQVRSLRGHLLRRRADCAYVLDHSNALIYGRLAARLLNLPQLCAIHRTRRADGSPSLGRMDRWLMRLSDRVVALSDTHARYLCEEEGVDSRRLAVIPNGVDPTRFRARPEGGVKREEGRRALGLPAEGLMLIVVAALRPEKNHEMLLRALAQLSIVPPPHLLVVGDGDLGTTLRRSADELGLSRRIHWFGWRDDIPELLAIADCLVLPSDPNVETFPMCVLEAMAASLPVVATDVGSLREMVEVGRTGTLVPPGQPQSLAQALEEILRDPMRRERMGAAGRARVTEHFHRRTMVSRTAALIRGVVAERRRVG